jgi:hypothetical protein
MARGVAAGGTRVGEEGGKLLKKKGREIGRDEVEEGREGRV